MLVLPGVPVHRARLGFRYIAGIYPTNSLALGVYGQHHIGGLLAVHGRGEITIASGPTIHRISNPTEKDLFTIHIYSPPLGDTVTNYTPMPTYDDE